MNCSAPTAVRAASPKPEFPHAEVLIATTWDCNLDCAYCFVRRQGRATEKEAMAVDQAAEVVEALDAGLKGAEVICLHFYGGEPLVNLPVIEAMVEEARRKHPGRFRFAVTTNGTISSPRVFDLLESGRFYVILSIDGPASIHDECRRVKNGTATHQSVMEFLENICTRTHCEVRGSAVVRSNWRLRQAERYLRTLPLDAIKAQAVRLPGGAPYALSAREKRFYRQDLEEVGRQVIEDIEAGRPPKDDRFSSRVLQLLTGKSRSSFCGAGRTIFGIIPDGNILPCVLLDTETCRLGHIQDDPESWYLAGRRWLAGCPTRSRCLKCFAFPLCGGGCPAIMPICGDDECDLIRANCRIAARIFHHFRSEPRRLLVLAGIT